MNISKASHKVFLYGQFFLGGREKSFSLADLTDAASVVKKLREDAIEIKNDDGVITNFRWEDSDLEFTVGESKILQGLVTSIKEATPSQSDLITELQELLK